MNSLLALLLRKGVQHVDSGRWADAQAAFAEVLRQQPDQPQALLLLAQLLQRHQQHAAAEELLLRLLRGSPGLADGWRRLGSVQEDMGRWADAEASYMRAAELDPGQPEATYNRARMLRRLGRTADAAGALARALDCKPSAPLLAQMLQLRALLEEDVGRLDLALATLDAALAVAPQRAALHHNRGALLQRLSCPAQALAAHDTALKLGLHAADAHYNRGNSLQSLGRSAEALQSYRFALALDPQHALALYDIARLRWRLGDDDFTAELDAAERAAPDAPLAPGIKGRLLLRAGRNVEAAASFARAAALADTAPGYFDGLGQALSRLGRFDEALAAHRRAVALAPGQAATSISHSATLLQAGKAALAAEAAEAAVRIDPLDQHAWALLGLAWRVAGHANDAWLNDYQQHVQVFDLAPPAGWPDAASFNAALAGALGQLHTDVQAPIDQTLRHGSQTLGDIFEQGHPLVDQLKSRIAEAVGGYIARLRALPQDEEHPLLGRIAPHWRFTDSWSSRLRSGGFHTAHVHAHGWISSCYYVALPPAITAAGGPDDAQAGWISFGTPDLQPPGCALPPCRTVQPKVGRLVLFPSFMWHATLPFTDAQARLTLAFDVMPGEG